MSFSVTARNWPLGSKAICAGSTPGAESGCVEPASEASRPSRLSRNPEIEPTPPFIEHVNEIAVRRHADRLQAAGRLPVDEFEPGVRDREDRKIATAGVDHKEPTLVVAQSDRALVAESSSAALGAGGVRAGCGQ